ncbi:MAG: 1-(5-phosphoribosyl)-5-[(5-phosphoribosylamino)methylideneamino]imidazole-4-carboxamide isomerase [Bdellovibrionales bacterium]
MDIYPAIDLIEGGCVRLTEGDFDARSDYAGSPAAVAESYEAAGAVWLHLVDLDGARDPAKRQTALIAEIVKKTKLKLQVGGGVRSLDDVRRLLDIGVARVIIGSLCVKDVARTKNILEQCGAEQITLALDVRGDAEKGFFVATSGWQETSACKIEDVIAQYAGLVKYVLCTDIACDGKLQGPNVALYRALVTRFPQLKIQASGGVAKLEDLDDVKGAAADTVVVGKALFEKRFTLSEALRRVA